MPCDACPRPVTRGGCHSVSAAGLVKMFLVVRAGATGVNWGKRDGGSRRSCSGISLPASKPLCDSSQSGTNS